jgi:Tfp pilus assembly protein PilV
VAVTKHHHRRHGTSLVEALAAIILLSVGALGIAATGVASLRLETSADQRSRAATAVSNRLELLHRGGCRSSSGTDTALNVLAAWHAVVADSIQNVVDSLVIPDRLAARPLTEVIQSAAPC